MNERTVHYRDQERFSRHRCGHYLDNEAIGTRKIKDVTCGLCLRLIESDLRKALGLPARPRWRGKADEMRALVQILLANGATCYAYTNQINCELPTFPIIQNRSRPHCDPPDAREVTFSAEEIWYEIPAKRK